MALKFQGDTRQDPLQALGAEPEWTQQIGAHDAFVFLRSEALLDEGSRVMSWREAVKACPSS